MVSELIATAVLYLFYIAAGLCGIMIAMFRLGNRVRESRRRYVIDSAANATVLLFVAAGILAIIGLVIK